jgi:hypothetical protein
VCGFGVEADGGFGRYGEAWCFVRGHGYVLIVTYLSEIRNGDKSSGLEFRSNGCERYIEGESKSLSSSTTQL